MLLNASGLGIGFGYLGRWLPAVITLAATLVWVWIGFAADASGWVVVWLGLWLIGVVAAMIVVARLAARHPQPATPRGRALPAVVGGVLVVALVAGYVLYGVAGSNVYADATAAQARADCPAAIQGFDTVDGGYRLAVNNSVAQARSNRAQCQAYLAASEAEQRGQFADAVGRYQDYRRDNPDTVLVPFAKDGVERTYRTWARSLRDAGNPLQAIDVYRDLLTEVADDRTRTTEVRGELGDTYLERIAGLTAEAGTGSGTQRATAARQAVESMQVVLRELADTPAAAAVPQAFTDTYYAADGLFTQGAFCDALPVLQYFSALAPDGLTSGAVSLAIAERATAMYECGLAQYNGSTFDQAISQLDQFVQAYPAEPRVAQARSILIAAHILAAASGAPPFLPAPLGDNNPGGISVTFYNDSQVEQHVYVAGPTAHEFVLPPCPGCPASYSYLTPSFGGGGPCDDLSGRPSLTLRLNPGTYLSVAESSIDSTDVDTSTIDPGFIYTNCVYIDEGFR